VGTGLTVGRDPACDAVVDVQHVSRRHAKVYQDGDAVYIRDLQSKNGTWVNGHRVVGRAPLSLGDEINLGLAAQLYLLDLSSPLVVRRNG